MTDDPTRTTELRRADAFIEQLRKIDDVNLKTHDVSVDPYELTEIDVSLTLTKPEPVDMATEDAEQTPERVVYERVAEQEQEHNDGAPINDLISWGRMQDEFEDTDELEDAIETLRRRGDVYEPTTGYLRVV